MAINRFAELTRDEGQDHATSNHGGRYIASKRNAEAGDHP